MQLSQLTRRVQLAMPLLLFDTILQGNNIVLLSPCSQVFYPKHKESILEKGFWLQK